jgi:hypothetical protein
VIEQYFALGDGLSMDPLLAETPTTPGPASMLASNLARNHQCGKYKNLCRERSRMSNIWLYSLPSILPSRGEVVVTISTGLEDLIDMGLELPEKGMIHSAVHETIGGYRRLVRTLRRLLPNALIIGTTVPDPTTGTGYFPVHRTPFPTTAVYLFNDLLKAYADKDDRFVVADVFDALSQPPAWSSPQNIQLSSYGCNRVSYAWFQEIQKAGLVPTTAAA